MSFKTITVLGSTGSVGKSTLDLIQHHKNKFKVVALTAHKNATLLIEQAIQFRPEIVAIGDKTFYAEIKANLEPYGIKVLVGEEGIIEAAAQPVDISIAAIVGISGLKPVMATLGCAKVLAIANKEPLVAAGQFVLPMAQTKNTKVLPLDSEHNAIFQVFENENRNAIDSLILTASGGPFRDWSYEEMEKATPEKAVAHPNWSMGAKISVDSATMMNKALEIIEAHYLFDMPPEKIDVLIHPQSIVHSMVAYHDGSILAQLGAPDMRTPIAYALAWPERMETSGSRLDWKTLQKLEFIEPDHARFPALSLAYDCLKTSAESAVILNAANEIAVDAFLNKKIGFNDILRLVAKTLETQPVNNVHSIDDVINFDKAVRERTKSYILA